MKVKLTCEPWIPLHHFPKIVNVSQLSYETRSSQYFTVDKEKITFSFINYLAGEKWIM